jgi:UDP:flavonoid glycosyltransferase YjiC (YdhE family)
MVASPGIWLSGPKSSDLVVTAPTAAGYIASTVLPRRMRVLFTCWPAYGHFHPMVALARALAASGHDVAFATAGAFCPYVELVGFGAFPAGLSDSEALAQAHASDNPPGLSAQAAGGPRNLSPAQRRAMSLGRASAHLRDLLPIIGRWRPDVLVHDESELAGSLAAALAGIPWVTHGLGIHRSRSDLGQAFWREHGRGLVTAQGMDRHLYLDLCPPGLATALARDFAESHPLQPVGFDDPTGQPLPAWVGELRRCSTVYVTLGTVYNAAPEVFTTVLDALRNEPLDIVVTLGSDGDPAAFGPQPPNVHIERYLAQTRLLPACDVVVTHGGMGTVFGALRNGLPLVILPQGAPSQTRGADACVAAGVGRRLLAQELTAASLRRDVTALLENSAYRTNANRLRCEIEAMPTPEAAANVIERLGVAN